MRATLRKDILSLALLWLVLTAAGEALVLWWKPMPLAAAKEAAIVDDAFRLLMIMAVPVFTFVVSMLLYSVLRFRTRGEPLQDGVPLYARPGVIVVWFAVTAALTIIMIFYPGISGMRELAALADEEVDLVVQAEGMRFAWRLTYPEYNVSTFKELVLPLGQHVRFEVTSMDVLHSFWVPAFRMKIDSVPGMVTTVHVTPNTIGTSQDDPNLRLQCAELCGLGHTVMTVPVRVVEQGEFDTWLAQQRQSR